MGMSFVRVARRVILNLSPSTVIPSSTFLLGRLLSMVITTMPAAQQSTTATTTTSSGSNTEVASLTSQKTRLESTQSGWELALSIALAVTAIAALLVFLFDLGVRKSSKRIETVQDEIIRAKDRELAANLREKDRQIAVAGQDSAHANERAGKAEENAAKAESNLAEANARAAEADAKGESFRLDIAEANKGAALAQAQVAGATAEAAKANLELARIKTPRSLTNAIAFTDSLKAFKGTRYVVSGCFQDQESMDFLVQLDAALTAAGWVREPLSAEGRAQITLNVAPGFAVPLTTRSGVLVGAQALERDALMATPFPQLPEYIRAAMALKGALASGINPQEGDFGPLQVDPGNSTSVFLLVGKKP